MRAARSPLKDLDGFGEERVNEALCFAPNALCLFRDRAEFDYLAGVHCNLLNRVDVGQMFALAKASLN